MSPSNVMSALHGGSSHGDPLHASGSHGSGSLERLLEHSSWIRAVASELVRDPDLVDEIEQRTLLVGLAGRARGPRSGVPFRSWLATVVRNVARQLARSERRRDAHERRGARGERLPSAAELVERAAVQRALVEAVLELDEPYRSTILLRYYEGLPPRDVAREHGVPVDTVRTRTARGIARLRERLDERDGGRAAWLAAFVPWTRPAPTAPGANIGPAASAASGNGAPSIGAGVALMQAKVKLVVASVLVLGVAAWMWTRPAEGARASAANDGDGTSTLVRSSSASNSPASAPDASDLARETLARAPSAHAGEPARTSIAPLVRGKVVDDQGRALAGIHVGLESTKEHTPERALAVSADDGTYSFPAQSEDARVVAFERAWTTVLAGTMSSAGSGAVAPRGEQVLVLAKPRAFAGSVVDALGAPIAGARVQVELDDSFRARFREVLDFSTAIVEARATGADGRFAFDPLPDLAEMQVEVRAEGFLDHRARLADLASETVIALVSPDAAERAIRGKVVDAAGTPVPRAHVAFGIDTTRADGDGLFAFSIDAPGRFARDFGVEPDALRALAPGFEPARFVPPTKDGKPAWPAFVVLQLGAPSLELRGRVLGADGEPLAGAHVWIMDATLFGGGPRGPQHVESLLAGVEDQAWRRIECAKDGSFAIEGLCDREYHVEAMDPATLLRVQEGPFTPSRAGGASRIELRLPKDALHPRVAGRVVSRTKKPVAGASVYPMCDAFRMRLKGEIVGTMHASVPSTTTGADGRFELANVPKDLVYLRIDGEDILPVEYGRDGKGDDRFASATTSRVPGNVEELEIVVALRCHVQVSLADPTFADEVAIVDAKGEALELNVYDGRGRATRPRFALADGRSPAFAVSDAGTAVVLYKAGVEVRRIPIELTPGPLVEVKG